MSNPWPSERFWVARTVFSDYYHFMQLIHLLSERPKKIKIAQVYFYNFSTLISTQFLQNLARLCLYNTPTRWLSPNLAWKILDLTASQQFLRLQISCKNSSGLRNYLQTTYGSSAKKVGRFWYKVWEMVISCYFALIYKKLGKSNSKLQSKWAFIIFSKHYFRMFCCKHPIQASYIKMIL